MISSILRPQPNQFIPVGSQASYVYDDTAHGGATHVIVERHALRSPHPWTLKPCSVSWVSWTRSLNINVSAGSLIWKQQLQVTQLSTIKTWYTYSLLSHSNIAKINQCWDGHMNVSNELKLKKRNVLYYKSDRVSNYLQLLYVCCEIKKKLISSDQSCKWK